MAYVTPGSTPLLLVKAIMEQLELALDFRKRAVRCENTKWTWLRQGPSSHYILNKAEHIELLAKPTQNTRMCRWTCAAPPCRGTSLCKPSLASPERDTGTSARWRWRPHNSPRTWNMRGQGRTSEQVLRRGGRARVFSRQNGRNSAEEHVRVQFILLQEQTQPDKFILASPCSPWSTIQLLSGKTPTGWDFLARKQEWHLENYLWFVTEVSEH